MLDTLTIARRLTEAGLEPARGSLDRGHLDRAPC